MDTKGSLTITAGPGRPEIVITREFAAPRDRVFRAFTDPALIPRWWGPRYLSTVVEAMDVRSGGSWRYLQWAKDGKQYGFHGVYHEVTANQRIIDTFEFEGLPERGHVALETTTFEALPGNSTRVTTRSVFQSVADRDGMVQSGMGTGVRDSYERLNELLLTM